MCGIFGYIGQKTDSADIVLKGLRLLEYRGYDSWGIAVVPSKTPFEVTVKKKAGKIGNATADDLPQSSIAIGHTRWATHGRVNDINSHPHLDCSKKIAIVHNGIFENYESVKSDLLNKGHKFISETDSEVIAHQIEEYIGKGLPFAHAVRKTFHNIKGLNALIAVSTYTKEIIAVRNGSPLVIGFGDREYFLASDPSALLPYTKKVYFLDDYEMVILTPDSPVFLNVVSGKKFKPEIQKLKWNSEEINKGKYPYYMLKEIYEQPDILKRIYAGQSRDRGSLDLIRKSENIFFVGCGSAYYASLAGTYLFSEIAKLKTGSVIGSEFGYQLEFLTPRDLVIAISQSGETMDILESVKKAKAKGAKILALVNVRGSTLYRMADRNILIDAGPEKSVASTKALTGMLFHLFLLARGISTGNKNDDYPLDLIKSVEKTLSPAIVARIRSLAAKLKDKKDVYVIGRGLSYVASLETAMKIKEISYIHAEGLAAGELKHGSLALVEKGTACIAFLPDDETFGANLAGAMEMKARGGYLVGISDKPRKLYDYFIPVESAGAVTIIPNIITTQLLAYYLAVKKGLDPDMPRNLAKSVTVK